LYNQLVRAGFHVKVARHNYRQAIATCAAYEIARQRKTIPPPAALLDRTYDSSLAMLHEMIKSNGKDSVVRSEFCLIEVLAVRG